MHTTTPAVAIHLQETVSSVFGHFAKLVARRQALDPQAMSRTDYLLLVTLEHCANEAGLRISGLATAVGNDLSTISRRVSHLEAHDLIERLPDPCDRRASTVRLTDAGRTVLTAERSARTGLLGRILADWPQDDLEDLDRLLTRLAADLAADAQSATPSPSFPPTTERTAS